jgi:hypothetical protein
MYLTAIRAMPGSLHLHVISPEHDVWSAVGWRVKSDPDTLDRGGRRRPIKVAPMSDGGVLLLAGLGIAFTLLMARRQLS